jgi:hypothetical protein
MNKTQLVEKAAAKGMKITRNADGSVVIAKGKRDGLMIWPDGTATRLGVDLVACTAIRTVREMASVLGVK